MPRRPLVVVPERGEGQRNTRLRVPRALRASFRFRRAERHLPVFVLSRSKTTTPPSSRRARHPLDARGLVGSGKARHGYPSLVEIGLRRRAGRGRAHPAGGCQGKRATPLRNRGASTGWRGGTTSTGGAHRGGGMGYPRGGRQAAEGLQRATERLRGCGGGTLRRRHS